MQLRRTPSTEQPAHGAEPPACGGVDRPASAPEQPGDAGAPPWLTADWVRSLAFQLLRRPSLWSVAIRQCFELAPSGWWRQRPFLPLPAPAYLQFRLQTMYGAGDHSPKPEDLVRWLAWCRDQKAYR